MWEAMCFKCGETFIPHDEGVLTLVHGVTEDGDECGGVGYVREFSHLTLGPSADLLDSLGIDSTGRDATITWPTLAFILTLRLGGTPT